MKTYVCIKQVPDTETRLQIKPDKSGIEESGIKWVMNPYDEYAVEEALKIREAKGGTVTVISVGPKSRVTDVLRTAMAMGADDAIVIDTAAFLDADLTARALANAITKEGAADLIFAGKLAIDDNAASVPQMVAERLNIPHVTVVNKLTLGDPLTVERESEGGARETYQIKGPCVLAANKGLNTPRYASLPGIMKAKKKTAQRAEPRRRGRERIGAQDQTQGFPSAGGQTRGQNARGRRRDAGARTGPIGHRRSESALGGSGNGERIRICRRSR